MVKKVNNPNSVWKMPQQTQVQISTMGVQKKDPAGWGEGLSEGSCYLKLLQGREWFNRGWSDPRSKSLGWMPSMCSWHLAGKNSMLSHSKEKEGLFREETHSIDSVCGAVNFYIGSWWVSSVLRWLYRLMIGWSIPVILEKGWGFQGIGPPPTFWHFVVILRTIMAPGVCYTESILRLKVKWKLSPPSWTQLVLISLCHVLLLLLKVVPCPLPSCFRNTLLLTVHAM